MSSWGQISFMNSSSPVMFFIESVYDWVMIVLMIVVSSVFYMMAALSQVSGLNRSLISAEKLEIVWTVLPVIALVTLAFPSLHCLYLLDEVSSPMVSMKAIGHQWFWSYELMDWGSISFNSYLKNESMMPRLLASEMVPLPSKVEIRLITTSTDVIHSWSVPSLGVKLDAIPGRLNQTLIYSHKVGPTYGQCSEICGSLHSFMPIGINFMPADLFLSWVKVQ
uniref:Cytochrome c oxidase subunit 2 n=1 Tax=Microthoracius praelongiceps TaxID=1958934 RepID=A0A1S5XVR5_9NEOP|nr:cytochrome c oxidase subunit 2 [Microthoracius praelongiceps]